MTFVPRDRLEPAYSYRVPDVDATYDFDLTASLPFGATFARSGSIEYVDSTGDFVSAAADTPVFSEYSWNGTIYEPKAGLRYHPANANRVRNNTGLQYFYATPAPGLTCDLSQVTEAGSDAIGFHLYGNLTSATGSTYIYPDLTSSYPVATGNSLLYGHYWRFTDLSAPNGLKLDLYAKDVTTPDITSFSTDGKATRNWTEVSDYSTTGSNFSVRTRLRHSATGPVDVSGVILGATVTYRENIAPSKTSGTISAGAADILTLPVASGIWNVLVETAEAAPYLIEMVMVGDAGWVVPPQPFPARTLQRIRLWPSQVMSSPQKRQVTEFTPGVWKHKFDPRYGVTFNDLGGLTDIEDQIGDMLLYNHDVGVSDEDDNHPAVNTEDGLTGIHVSPGQVLYADNVTYTNRMTWAFAFVSYSTLKQCFMSCNYGTDEYDDAVKFCIHGALNTISAEIDYVLAARTDPLPGTFDVPCCAVITIDGRNVRFDVAIGVAGQPGVYQNYSKSTTTAARFIDKPGKEFFRSFIGRDEFGPGIIYSIHGNEDEAFTPAQSLHACKEIIYDLKAQVLPGAALDPLPLVSAIDTGSNFHDSVVITANLTGIPQVGAVLKISREADFSVIDYEESILPDPTKCDATIPYVRLRYDVSGLPEGNTEYWAKIIIDGRDVQTPISFTTMPEPWSEDVIYVGVESCTDTRKSTSIPVQRYFSIRSPRLHQVVHLGDLEYSNHRTGDLKTLRRSLWHRFSHNASVKQTSSRVSWRYTWGDHDTGQNDNYWSIGGNASGWTQPMIYAQDRKVYDETVPYDQFPLPGTIYQHWAYNDIFWAIMPDQFSRRDLANGTALGNATYPTTGCDQFQFLKDDIVAAGVAGYKWVILFVSEWDSWALDAPEERAEFIAWYQNQRATVSTTPRMHVVGGDIHRGYSDDGAKFGFSVTVSSPAKYFANSNNFTDRRTIWAATNTQLTGQAVGDSNANNQCAVLELHPGTDRAGRIVIRGYSGPYIDGIATERYVVDTDDIGPAIFFPTTTVEALPGDVLTVEVNRSGYGAEDVEECDWTTNEAVPQTGTITWAPDVLETFLTVNAPSDGSPLTITLSNSTTPGIISPASNTMTILPPSVKLDWRHGEFSRGATTYADLADVEGWSFNRPSVGKARNTGPLVDGLWSWGSEESFAAEEPRITDIGMLFGAEWEQLAPEPVAFENWTTVGSLAVTPGAIEGPDGIAGSGYKLEVTATGSSSRYLTSPEIDFVDGGSYYFVVTAKEGELRYLRVSTPNSAFKDTTFVTFDLQTGAVVNNSTGPIPDYAFERLSNGWFRLVLRYTANATATGRPFIYGTSSAGGNSTFTGVVGRGIYLHSFNVFKFSGAGTVGREAFPEFGVSKMDKAVLANTPVAADFAVFVSVFVPRVPSSSGDVRGIFALNDGLLSDGSKVALYASTAGGYRLGVWIAGTGYAIATTSGFLAGWNHFCVRRLNGLWSLWANGAQVGSSVAKALPSGLSMTQFGNAHGDWSTPLGGYIAHYQHINGPVSDLRAANDTQEGALEEGGFRGLSEDGFRVLEEGT